MVCPAIRLIKKIYFDAKLKGAYLKNMTTLIIIGNGFDLSHGLHTSYGHLKKFIEAEDRQIAEQINQQLFVGEEDAWNNFEENVGTDDSYFKSAFQQAILLAYEAGENMDTGADPMQGDVLIQMDKNDINREQEIKDTLSSEYSSLKFDDLYKFFIQLLEKMLNSEEANRIVKVNPDIKSKIENNHNVKFITFNYTHTLQKTYNIPDSDILHIHGELGRSRELIFGNSNDNLVYLNPNHFIKEDEEAKEWAESKDRYDTYMKENEEANNWDAIEMSWPPETGHDYSSHPTPNSVDSSEFVISYNESKEAWIKEPNIQDFNDYISDLDVDKIIVIGHSLGLVDSEYFNSLESHFPNAKWEISVHEPDEKIDEVRNNFTKLFHSKTVRFFNL